MTAIVDTTSQQNTQNTPIMTKEQFDSFVKSSCISFLTSHNLEKIVVEDGTGRRGQVKINKNGEYVVQITSKEVL